MNNCECGCYEFVDGVMDYIWQHADAGVDMEAFFLAIRKRANEELLDLLAADDDGSE